MGNTLGVEAKPPTLAEFLGETDEPEKSPSPTAAYSDTPQFYSFLRGWEFSTSDNGLLGSTTPIEWLEFSAFSEKSCYLVVHAFAKGPKAPEPEEFQASASKPAGGPNESKDSTSMARKRSNGSDHAAEERLTQLLQSAAVITPRGQSNVFGGYHAPGANRKKMTAISYDIYVMRGTQATAISKSTATAKAVEIEQLLSDTSVQQAVRSLCCAEGGTRVIPFLTRENLYCMESVGMELWSKTLSRNHLFATVTRYASKRDSARASISSAVAKQKRSGSLPSSSTIASLPSGAAQSQKDEESEAEPEAEPEPKPEAEIEAAPAPAPEPEPKKTRPTDAESKKKAKEKRKSSRSSSRSKKKKTKQRHSEVDRVARAQNFRSVSLPPSEMQKLKLGSIGRNVPTIQIPMGLNSLEHTVHEPKEDGKPMGGASMAKKFDGICSHIDERLYLGSDTVAHDRRLLKRNKITHILNCAGGYCGNYFPDSFTYMTLHLLDGKSENIACLFYEVLEFIDNAISNGGSVFVHCQQGVSRSSAMLILYLMWKKHTPFNETHEYVKKLRQASSPNAGFISQLMEWWKSHTTPMTEPELYQVVPHCPVAADTIVFRRIRAVAVDSLDRRGCFVLRDADHIYVWCGKSCQPLLVEWGIRYAKRIKNFERDSAEVSVEQHGSESEGFKFIFGGSLAKVGRKPEYDESYQLLKLQSRGSDPSLPDIAIDSDSLPASAPTSPVKRQEILSADGSPKKKRKKRSKKQLVDRVSSSPKIARFSLNEG